jgi:hypothetical protein
MSDTLAPLPATLPDRCSEVVPQGGVGSPRLLDRVRGVLHARHYSRRTERAYVGWIKRFIFFHAKRHPNEMGATEVTKSKPYSRSSVACHVSWLR